MRAAEQGVQGAEWRDEEEEEAIPFNPIQFGAFLSSTLDLDGLFLPHLLLFYTHR